MEEHKRELDKQLWNIANTLRGKMNADEFRDYILGFIFYKYLSERMALFADRILEQDKLTFTELTPKMPDYENFMKELKGEA
ncbi:MAG: type I restriction-modification system subunit M N-terminal domain-containing protein, partial [Saprospiraceae bacterium]|nr:type I restriction-modification system subunit M N-terminal domain-containing protein [Saprospiraceae bacterium]